MEAKIIETEIKTINANGINFAYLEKKGEKEPASNGHQPLVLCLHGFPDTAYSFLATIECLSEAGYRVIAPFMRGYFPSSLAPDKDYSLLSLGHDVLALIDAFDEENAIVIGHDWGGFAAIAAANMQPEKITKLVFMCVPHLFNNTNSLAQLKKSWYVMFFQIPWLPEYQVPKNNYQFIDNLYRAWSPNWSKDEWELQHLKKSLAMPGGLAAALAYYRAMIRGFSMAQWRVMSAQTTVPSLVFAGEADGSVGIELFTGVDSAFTDLYEFVSYKDVGHFPHRENFDAFSAKVLEFLGSSSTPSR